MNINLDDKQLDILLSNKNNKFNKCIFACPGAGKTRLLISEIVYLLKEKDIDCNKIVSISFTKKAAGQMRERLKEYINNIPYGIKIGTFHNITFNILRSVEYKGLDKYDIIDESDFRSIIKKVLNQNIKKYKSNFPEFDDKNNLNNFYKKINNFLLSIFYSKGNDYNLIIDNKISDIVNDNLYYFNKIKLNISFFKNFLVENYNDIKVFKNNKKYLYFDDIIHHFIEFMDSYEGIEYCKSIGYMFVDEYQDINNSQGILLEKIYKNNPEIIFTVVGDDAQSIYKFRGSEPKYIKEFNNKFLPCKTFYLENNYRSSPEIIELCNAIICKNNDNVKKNMNSIKKSNDKPILAQFENEKEEANFVADTIHKLLNVGYKNNEIAVLSRTNRYTCAIELALTKYRIPHYNLSGLSLFETKHVKDFMAFIHLLINPESELHFTRILLMINSVAEKTVEKILKKVSNNNYLEYIINISETSKYYDKLQTVSLLFKQLVSKSPIEVYYIVFTYLKDYIEEKYKKKQENMDDIGKLEYFFSVYDNLKDMIIDLHLTEVNKLDTLSNERILISSIHQSKGLEYKNVFIVGSQNSPLSTSIYSDEDIFEERRVFFVACSRAIDNLFISCAKEESMNFASKQDGFFNTSYGSIFINEILYYNENLVNNFNYQLTEPINKDNLSDIIKNKILRLGPSYIHQQIKDLEYERNYFDSSYNVDNYFYLKLVGVMFDLILVRINIEKFKKYQVYQNLFYEINDNNIYKPLLEIFTDYKIPMGSEEVIDSIIKLSILNYYGVKYVENSSNYINNLIKIFKNKFNNDIFKQFLKDFKEDFFELIDRLNLKYDKEVCFHKNIYHNNVKGQIDLLISNVLVEIKYSKYPLLNSINCAQVLSYNHMMKDNKIKYCLLINPCTGEYVIIENNDKNLSISENIFKNFIIT
jgi:DNA helicase II / ATP-dependent DNA helicase PcrA